MIGTIITDIIQNDEPLMRMVMDSPIMIIVFKEPGFIVDFANTKTCQILGKAWKEIANHQFFELFPELAEQGYKEILQQVIDSGETYVAQEMPVNVISNMDESEYVSFTLQPFKNNKDEVTHIFGIATNVTELVKSKKLIQENEVKYRAVLEGANMGYSLLELLLDENNRPYDYIFLEVNPAFERILGMTDVIGKRVKEIIPEIEDFWIDTYGQIVLSGQGMTVVHEAKQFNSIYEAHAFRLGDENSKKVAVLFNDITDKVEKDRLAKRFAEELQKQVAQRTNQLEENIFELRQFAHVMRHDLKEPLRKNKFFLSLLESSLKGKLSELESDYFRKLFSGLDRIEKILEGVITYSNAESIDPDCLEVDLNSIMHLIAEDLDMLIERKNAQLIISPLPGVNGITLLIYQLFYNIIYNSLKFARKDVPCIITIDSKIKTIKHAKFAIIYVKDNGIGFEAIYRNKIFRAFTRLNSKDDYEGTGMGLAISRKIVERHGGSITAESIPNEGSEFRIILPMSWKE